MSIELLDSCPFCGNDMPTIVEAPTQVDQEVFTIYYVSCPKCQASGPMKLERDSAVSAWNSRTTATNN